MPKKKCYHFFLSAVLLLLVVKPAFSATTSGTAIESYAELYYGSQVVISETITTEVSRIYGLTLTPTDSANSILPSKTCYFAHQVDNVGNNSDQITFFLSPPTPEGWTAALLKDDNMNGIHEDTETTPVPVNVDLAEDAIYYFFLALTAPTVESSGSATVTVTSEGNDGPGFYGANGIFYGGDDQVSAKDTASATYGNLYNLYISRDDPSGVITLHWQGGVGDLYYIGPSYEASFAGASVEAYNVSSPFVSSTTIAGDGITRYYRVTKAGTTDGFAPQTASKIDLAFPVGYELISVPETFTAESGSYLNILVGTQLTGGTVPSYSDKIYSFQGAIWKQAYLKTGVGWSGSLDRLTGDKAAWVQILNGHPAKTVTFAGQVPTSDSVAIGLNTGYTFVGSVYPVNVDLDSSGLSAALTSGTLPSNSDKVYSFQEGVWKQAWLKTGVGFMGSLTDLSPGTGYWIFKQGGASTWTYPRPY